MSKELVLVTGATGHLGFRTLVFTLQHGFKARVALRKLEQAEKLKATASLKPYLNDIEFVHVPDITADGAYDEAIKGVDYVIHVASPIYSGFTSDMEPRVKRVIITPSVGVIEPKNGASRAGPNDIKAVPPQEMLDAPPFAAMAYVWSKVLSHVQSTEYVEKNNVHYDLIRVLPGYIQGANELYSSADEMRDPAVLGSNEGSMLVALGIKVNGPKPHEQVFLDDAAKAHVIALKAEGVKNLDNLLLVGNGGDSTPWKDVVSVVEKLYPEEVKNGVLKPAMGDEDKGGDSDVASSEKALGFKFAGPDVYVRSVVDQYLDFVGK